jgi:hypothetical protein
MKAEGEIMLVERSGVDRRKFPRYAVDWNASIKMGDKEIYNDRIYDLSLGGAAIYAEKNIITKEPLVILIDTPLPHFMQKKIVTRIDCKLCHTEQPPTDRSKFHIGVNFMRLYGMEKHLLAEALFDRPALPVRRLH